MFGVSELSWKTFDDREGSLTPGYKRRLNVLLDGVGLGLRRVSLQGMAGSVHKKLREVPLDALRAEKTRLRFLEEFVKGMSSGTVDINL
jgi:hypothetical protein